MRLVSHGFLRGRQEEAGLTDRGEAGPWGMPMTQAWQVRTWVSPLIIPAPWCQFQKWVWAGMSVSPRIHTPHY